MWSASIFTIIMTLVFHFAILYMVIVFMFELFLYVPFCIHNDYLLSSFCSPTFAVDQFWRLFLRSSTFFNERYKVCIYNRQCLTRF